MTWKVSGMTPGKLVLKIYNPLQGAIKWLDRVEYLRQHQDE
jgi:hypothetical protein